MLTNRQIVAVWITMVRQTGSWVYRSDRQCNGRQRGSWQLVSVDGWWVGRLE